MATSSIKSAPNCAADEQVLQGYELALRGALRAEKTLETYRESLKTLQRFLVERAMPPLTAASTEHLREFFNTLYQRGNKATTVSVRYRAIKQFYKWLLVEGERPDDPMLRIQAPRVPDKLQPHYTTEELRKVLGSLPNMSRDPLILRNKAMLLTLLDSGLRASELCGLQVEDLNLRTLALVVRQPKGGRERIVGIGGVTAQAIERYLRRRQMPSPWLFATVGGRPLSYNTVRQITEHLFRDAGVPFRGVHGFRRSFAMAFLDAGGDPADLQTLAGWSSPAMLRRYTRATEGQRALRAARKFSPVDRMGLGR